MAQGVIVGEELRWAQGREESRCRGLRGLRGEIVSVCACPFHLQCRDALRTARCNLAVGWARRRRITADRRT